jgi:hypothetical protein
VSCSRASYADVRLRRPLHLVIALLPLAVVDCSSETHVHCDDVLDIADRGCERRFALCSDGHEYRIVCADLTHTPYSCACMVDGKTAKTVTSSTFCAGGEAVRPVLDACGFDLR